MTTRSQVGTGLVAALATLAAASPLTVLWRTSSWVPSCVAAIAIVAVTGMVGRRRLPGAAAVLVAQLAALGALLVLVHLRGDLTLGVLPTASTLDEAEDLVAEALHVIQSYAVPAPVPPGIAFSLTLLVGSLAVAVDFLAVTLGRPLAAGVPLLTAYLVTAANRTDVLPWYAFGLAAGSWLLLLARPGVLQMNAEDGWPIRGGAGAPRQDPAGRFTRLAQVMGSAVLVSALVVASALPHLPPRFLTEGLGRSAEGSGGAGGNVRLSTTADLARSLRARSTAPVLTYRSTSSSPPPLRVDVLGTYAYGEWRTLANRTEQPVSASGLTLPEEAGATARSRRSRIDVQESTLAAPQLAVPYPVIRITSSGGEVTQDPALNLRVDRALGSYSAIYLEPDPALTTLQQPVDPGGDGMDASLATSLGVPAEARDAITAFAEETAPAPRTRLDAARRIQQRLRSTEFTYSLDVPAAPTGPAGSPLDPISAFLRTKTGYCTHYASAMVFAARALGIPARLAVGFLPGVRVDGRYRVLASDAHAWPELYFEGVGWLRFEPTPGGRSGNAPGYSLPATRAGDNGRSPATSSGTSSTTAGTTTTTRPAERDAGAGAAERSRSTGSTDRGLRQVLADLGPAARVLIALVLLALVLSILPVSARWTRRRARVAARSDGELIETAWRSMLTRLGDLGLRPSASGTPRQVGAEIRDLAWLTDDDDAAALERVVAAVEQARYARPGSRQPRVTADVEAVVRAAARSRPRKRRLRAALLPHEGVRLWRGLNLTGRRRH